MEVKKYIIIKARNFYEKINVEYTHEKFKNIGKNSVLSGEKKLNILKKWQNILCEKKSIWNINILLLINMYLNAKLMENGKCNINFATSTNMKLQNAILYFQIGNVCDCHVA